MATRPTTIRLLSVNVSQPKPLAEDRSGETIWSGIAKLPVDAHQVAVRTLNVDGDGQADLTVHGGVDKAVYAYSADHFAAWHDDTGQDFGPGGLGENLTIAGAAEHDVCIGDRWLWGDAELEVCQPRFPCFKLTLYRRSADVGRLMRSTGRSGWYLRVLREGTAPTAGPVEVVPHPDGVTIAEANRALRSLDPALVRRVAGAPALAESWRAQVGRHPDA